MLRFLLFDGKADAGTDGNTAGGNGGDIGCDTAGGDGGDASGSKDGGLPIASSTFSSGSGVMELHQAQTWEGEMVEDSRRLHLYIPIMQIAN